MDVFPSQIDHSVAAPLVANTSTLPTFEDALNTQMGKKMPKVMKLVASLLLEGNTREKIAAEVQIPPGLVDDYVREMVRCLRCQPPRLVSVARARRATVRNGARSVIPQLGKLRLDQIGPENQQIFVNQLVGASRKTVLNILSTLSSMLTTAKDWGYSCRSIEVRKLVLPERNTHVAAHFTRSQVESIFGLTQDPWRTFFVLLTLTGMRAGEALGLQWGDIDFDHQCIHIRRSAWYGKAQSTKSKGSAVPITLPTALSAVLAEYKTNWKPNPDGYLFVTRNGRPPSSNKVVEYQLWPILDALGIPRCGLHAFRHSVASFIVDAGYSIEVAREQLRHSNVRTTLGYTHFRGGVTEQAMTDVSNSLKLDAVGRGAGKGSQYIQ